MKFNCADLLKLANDLIALGMDGRLSVNDRMRAGVLGERVRIIELVLDAKEFGQLTDLFRQATDELKRTNECLEEAKQFVDKTAGALEKVASLMEILERLIGVAIKLK